MAIAYSCTRLEPCLDQAEYECKREDTLVIVSCSPGAEAYEWLIDGKAINNFLNPPQPFFTHYVTDGGEACDPFMSVIFSDTGSHSVELIVKKISSGGCSEEFKPGKTKAIKANIKVK